MGEKKAPLQAGGLQCWLRVLKAKVCLKNILISTPELPERGGEFYINTVKNNPYIPEWFFFLCNPNLSCKTHPAHLSAQFSQKMKSCSIWVFFPFLKFFFFSPSWIHKIHCFRTAPPSMKMLGARILFGEGPSESVEVTLAACPPAIQQLRENQPKRKKILMTPQDQPCLLPFPLLPKGVYFTHCTKVSLSGNPSSKTPRLSAGTFQSPEDLNLVFQQLLIYQ